MGSLSSKPEEGETVFPIPQNATCVEDFGYEWRNVVPDSPHHDYNYRLIDVNTGEPFKFLNQKHYEALGEVVAQYVTQLMVKDFDLETVELVPDVSVYLTKDAKENENRLMLIIQGAGPVRAGQWSRSLCINESLACGTMLPYMHRAKKLGFAIVIANPNCNLKYNTEEGKWTPIEGSATPEEHVQTLWDKIVSPLPAKEIVIVGHSYGGISMVNLLKNRPDDIMKRVKAVALTDSVHYRVWNKIKGDLSKEAKKWWSESALNWIKSKTPLGTVYGEQCGCEAVSAGHEQHEWTPTTAMDAVFEFLESKITPLPKKTIRKKSSKRLKAAKLRSNSSS